MQYVPSTWRRLWAKLIDQVFVGLLFVPFLPLYWQAWQSGEGLIEVSIWLGVYLLVAPIFYEFLFLYLFSRTPGKWLLGLRVVCADHLENDLGWENCLLRALVARLDFFFSWAIYALAFWRYDRTHLADWVAGTRVVQAFSRPQRPKKRWLLGIFFVLMFGLEGWVNAISILQQVDWQRGVIGIELPTEAQSDFEWDEEFEI